MSLILAIGYNTCKSSNIRGKGRVGRSVQRQGEEEEGIEDNSV
jgi:hypothetical protein